MDILVVCNSCGNECLFSFWQSGTTKQFRYCNSTIIVPTLDESEFNRLKYEAILRNLKNAESEKKQFVDWVRDIFGIKLTYGFGFASILLYITGIFQFPDLGYGIIVQLVYVFGFGAAIWAFIYLIIWKILIILKKIFKGR